MGSLLGVGADAGEHAAWAVVESDGRSYRLVALHDVYGEGRHWMRRAQVGARLTWERVRGHEGERLEVAASVPVWIEVPPVHSRRDERGQRHSQQSWTGLGRRVGLLEAFWYVETAGASLAERVEPSTWWKELHGLIAKGGKSARDGGLHRVLEATALVSGAGPALQLVSPSRRVDAAESILIAAAAVKATSVDAAILKHIEHHGLEHGKRGYL